MTLCSSTMASVSRRQYSRSAFLTEVSASESRSPCTLSQTHSHY
jgi:hypothetical protein